MGDNDPPNSAWLPEDDFKLINAIEGGQSLRELANGAVQFSKKVTHRELRQRWYSLLYDPYISAEAAQNMIELQQRKTSSGSGGSNTYNGVYSKRNGESVQQIYYSRCKRSCKEQVEERSPDPDDCYTEPVSTGLCEILSDSNIDDAGRDSYLKSSSSDFTNDELFHMDVHRKKVLDDDDGQNTLFLNSPNDVCQIPLPETTEVKRTVISDPYLAEPSVARAKINSEPQMVSSVPTYDQQFPNGTICCALNTKNTDIPCNADALLPSKVRQSLESSAAPKRYEKPNNLSTSSVNDHVGIPKSSQGVSDDWQRGLEEINYLMPSTDPSDKQVSERGPVQLKKEMGSYLESSTMRDCLSKQNISGGIPDLRTKVKRNLLSSSVKGCLVMQERGLYQERELMKAKSISSSVNVRPVQQKVSERGLDQIQREVKSSKASYVSAQVMSSEPSHSGKQKISEIGPDQTRSKLKSSGLPHVGIDDHIPCFSDVEAMILNMDLIPGDQDLSTCQEVLKYQDEDTVKSVIRLEQAANASKRRDIASHGAFASLYGHHFKYYIKKPQVSLGRAEGGSYVDIDLRREGKASKISRLQAIIGLLRDGSFYMKNLGKYSIYVNAKEVVPGKSVKLCSDCLIEIQELVFDVNPTQVKAYIENVSY